jgi:hypothetical protein
VKIPSESPPARPSTGSRTSSQTDPADVCIVCGAHSGRRGVTLCSRRCLRAASRELESNARQIKNFQRDADRSELMARNGTLTAALIAWSPE